MTPCIEAALGRVLNPERPHLSPFAQGFDCLGYAVLARTLRRGEKVDGCFKTQIKALSRGRHPRDAEWV